MSHMSRLQYAGMLRALEDVEVERYRQHEVRGEQDLPDGRLMYRTALLPIGLRAEREQATEPTWAAVLLEEVAEVVLAGDDAALRAELVQVAAVAVQWIEALDRAAGRVAARTDPAPCPRVGETIVAPAGACCECGEHDAKAVVRGYGLRSTAPRDAVVRVLMGGRRYDGLTHAEVCRELPEFNRASIYRALRDLERALALDRIPQPPQIGQKLPDLWRPTAHPWCPEAA